MDKKKVKVWTCKIVVPDVDLPAGFDSPPRMAAQAAIEAAGIEVLMNSSGWGGELDEYDEKALEAIATDAYPNVYFAGVMDAPEDTSH